MSICYFAWGMGAQLLSDLLPSLCSHVFEVGLDSGVAIDLLVDCMQPQASTQNRLRQYCFQQDISASEGTAPEICQICQTFSSKMYYRMASIGRCQ